MPFPLLALLVALFGAGPSGAAAAEKRPLLPAGRTPFEADGGGRVGRFAPVNRLQACPRR